MPYSSASALYAATVSLIALAAPAAAGCVQTGSQIQCAGLETTPVTADDAEKLTVQAGASVKIATGTAVSLLADDAVPGGTTVDVMGVISADDPAGSDAVKLDSGDTVRVGEQGQIVAGDDGVQAKNKLRFENAGMVQVDDKGVTAGHDANITNSGTIQAGGEGINLKHRATITNMGQIITVDRGIDVKDDALIVNSGSIQAVDEGIEMDDGGTLINSGLIQSTGDDGINPGESATVVNLMGAMIEASDDGIDIDSGVIVNLGDITSTDAAGVDVDGAENDLTILNHGSIMGQTGILVEDGTGGPANTKSQVVLMGVTAPLLLGGATDVTDALSYVPELPETPQVTLAGVQGVAASLGAGDDVFAIEGDVAIYGDVLLGGDQDTLDVIDLPSLFAPAIGLRAAGPETLLFDGGDDFDVANFVMSQDEFLSIASVSGSDVILAVTDPKRGNPFEMVLRNFEQFDLFAGPRTGPLASFDLASLSAALTSEVPLPAGVVLMGSALAGLGALRRRR